MSDRETASMDGTGGAGKEERQATGEQEQWEQK